MLLAVAAWSMIWMPAAGSSIPEACGQSQADTNLLQVSTEIRPKARTPPKYSLGVSTGHVGTTTLSSADSYMMGPGNASSSMTVQEPPEIIRASVLVSVFALLCVGVSAFIFEWVMRKVYTDDGLLFHTGKMPHLTGLRGLAMLAVVLSHSGSLFLPYHIYFAAYGGTAVYVFFVLSGFLMGALYLNKPFTYSNVWSYVVARASRIFPAYWVVVIATSFMTNNYGLDLLCALEFRGGAMQLWTVPVEVQFYAIFIILWWAYSRAGLLPFIFMFSLHVVLFAIPVSGGPLLHIVECGCLSRFCILQHLPTFCTGVVLGGRWDDIVRLFPGGRVLDMVGLLSIIGLPLTKWTRKYWWDDVLSSWVGQSKDSLYTQSLMPLDPLAYLFAAGLMIAAAQTTPSLNVLSSRMLILCGNISFMSYLIHLQIIEYIKLEVDGLPIWIRLLVLMSLFMAIFSIATLSLHLFEAPAMRLGRKVGQCLEVQEINK